MTDPNSSYLAMRMSYPDRGQRSRWLLCHVTLHKGQFVEPNGWEK